MHHPDSASILRSACWLLAGALALSACATDAEDPSVAEASAALGASCSLGDGYVIPSGGSKTIYPVTCPSDCNDFPNGGLDYTLFCLNGVLGEWDPALAGGTVGPPVNGLAFNGYSRCTARPNPWSTPMWGQTPDRKHCSQL
jgi:hypothetical protein